MGKYHPHGDVAQAKQADEGEQGESVQAIAHEEIDERADDGAVQEDQRLAQPVRQRAETGGEIRNLALALGGPAGDAGLRLGDDQRGHEAHQCAGRHQAVGGRPGRELGDVERACAREQPRGNAVAELVGRGRRALQALVAHLDAKGIHGDVLRRRREGDDQCIDHQGEEIRARVAERHAQQPEPDAGLCQEHPRASPAEPAREQRQRHAVHHRRPHELERIGDADPADEADRRATDAILAQPGRQRREHQQERQAGREAQEQERDDARMGIGRERRCPAFVGSRAQINPFSAWSGRAPTWEMISAAAIPPSRAHSARALPRVKPNRKPAA